MTDNNMINIQIPDADAPNAGDKLNTALRLAYPYLSLIIHDEFGLKNHYSVSLFRKVQKEPFSILDRRKDLK